MNEIYLTRGDVWLENEDGRGVDGRTDGQGAGGGGQVGWGGSDVSSPSLQSFIVLVFLMMIYIYISF